MAKSTKSRAKTRTAKKTAKRKSVKGTKQPGRLRRLLLRLMMLIGFVVSLPLILPWIYSLDGVRPVSTLMLYDTVRFNDVDRQWVDLEDMNPAMPQSVLMSEDGKFCAHSGVDWDALQTEIGNALGGEGSRGASTLSMQLVKNLYLWPGRSYVRKMAEVPLALYFDKIVPKRRTMEIYLNIAEWGPGIYGVEAAAQAYFGKSAKQLTRRQAALLTVALPNPHLRNPANPTRKLNQLARIVERRARASGGYIGCLKLN